MPAIKNELLEVKRCSVGAFDDACVEGTRVVVLGEVLIEIEGCVADWPGWLLRWLCRGRARAYSERDQSGQPSTFHFLISSMRDSSWVCEGSDMVARPDISDLLSSLVRVVRLTITPGSGANRIVLLISV